MKISTSTLIAFIIFLFSFGYSSAQVSIVPQTVAGVSNCFPFGTTIYYQTFMGFTYRNIPAFTLHPGDKISFDLGSMAALDIKRNIYFSVTNINPNANNGTSQGVHAIAWTKVVSESQTPLNPRGNNIIGDYELTFTAESNFTFNGGGFMIGFDGAPPATYIDNNCSQVLAIANSSDGSGYFYNRFYSVPSQTTAIIDAGGGDNSSIAGFKINAISEPLPVATITSTGPTSFCLPGSVVLNASTSSTSSWTYQWFLNASVISGATANTYTANQSGSYTVTVTNTIAQSVTSAAIVVTANPLPVPVISATGPTTFCTGGNVTLTGAGSAIDLNGSNQYITMANGYAATSNLTYEAWVYPKSFSGFNVVINSASWAQGYVHFQFNNGTLGFSVNGNSPTDYNCTYPFTANNWYHIAATYSQSSKTLKFYVNGNLVNTYNYSIAVNVTGNIPFKIGAWDGQRFFNGTFDEVRIWNTERTALNIQSNMNQSVPTNSTGLVSYYKMDEDAGTSTADATGTNTGTLVNGASWINSAPAFATTYLWSTSATTQSINVTTSGNYSLTVKNTYGCTSVPITKIVTVNPLPVITAANNGPLNPGSTLNLSATGASTYSWTDKNGIASPLSIANITSANAGTYSVVGKDANGCSAVASTLVVVNTKPAGALNFDGNTKIGGHSGYVKITNPFTNFKKEITVEWSGNIDPASNIGSGPGQSLENIDGGNSLVWLMHYYPGTNALQWFISDNGAWKEVETTVLAGWHKYVGVASATGMQLYVDGVLKASSNNGVTIGILNVPTAVMEIGKDSRWTDRFFKGSVDEVRVWSRALCQAEILNNQKGEITTPYNGLEEYYKFNQGNSQDVNTGITTLLDASGNGRNGTLINFGNLTGPTLNWVDGYVTGIIPTYTAPGPTFSGTNASLQRSTSASSCTALGNYYGGNNSLTITNADKITYVLSGATTASGIGAGFDQLFNIGVSNVSITASNSCGSSNTTFMVTVVDNTPPVITGAPSDLTVYTNPGRTSCDQLAIWTPPTAIDNCGTVTVVSNHNPGDLFPVGTTNVTYTFTDSYANSSKTSFNVIVVDNTQPVISGILGDQNFTSGIGRATCDAVGSWTPPTATDNCGTVTVTSNHNPGDVFPVGSTLVTYTFTDIHNNSISTGFHVNVVDNTAPVISGVPLDVNVNTEAGRKTCDQVATWIPPTGTDNCSGTVTVSSDHQPGDIFPVGSTAVTYTFTDANNNASICTFNVIVTDNTQPVISGLLGDQNFTSGIGRATCDAVGSWTPPTATDNCGTVTVTSNHNPGDVFPVGSTLVTYTFTDIHNNSISTGFHVNVVDNTAPVISGVPLDVNVNTEAGRKTCDQVATWIPPTGTDNCSGTVTVSSDHQPGDIFPVGSTAVTYTFTDANNNASICTFNVIVTDNTQPVISGLLGDQNFATGIGRATCDAVGSWTPPTATDNCGTVTVTSNHNPGDVFPVGSTLVTYTFTDIHNNIISTSFHVNVVDNTPPVLSVPADALLNCQDDNSTSKTGVATGKDNCSPVVITYSDASSQSSDINNAAHYNYNISRTWTASDVSGNSTTTMQTIKVHDITAPSIVVPASITLNCQDNTTSSSTGLATGTDICSPVTITQSDVSTQDQNVNASAHYNYTITRIWTATDVSGNSTSGVQTITVHDITAPSIIVPASVTLNCQDNTTSSSTGLATGTDICSPVTITQSDVSTQDQNVNAAAHYNYTISRTWKATDVTGNSTTGVQTITVLDVTAPVLSVPGNISVINDKGNCSSLQSFLASATDNCSPVTITYSQQPGTAFIVGTTIVTVKATDVTGNISTGTFSVIVTDTEKPVVLTNNVTVTLINGVATIDTLVIDNGSHDNCGIQSLSLSKTVFHCADIGNNTVTFTVTDIHGNVQTATAIVTVKGETPGATIASVPTSSVFTGGVNTNLYLGYGAQSTTLQVTPVAAAGNSDTGNTYTYLWSGISVSMLSSKTAQAPVFTPTAAGFYTFTVTVTNNYGCTTTANISICVRDIRVAGSNGKVYVCHVPPGNPGNSQTLSISVNAVPAHLGNHAGDRLGSCDMVPCSGSLTSIHQEVETEIKLIVNELTVVASPNPTNTDFKLKITSNDIITPATIRIVDASGRPIQLFNKVAIGSTITFGSHYAAGSYYAQVMQGTQSKVVKLIKML